MPLNPRPSPSPHRRNTLHPPPAPTSQVFKVIQKIPIHVAVPHQETGLAKAFGEAHRLYTRMKNFEEGVRGYLFQGRFSSVVLDERRLMAGSGALCGDESCACRYGRPCMGVPLVDRVQVFTRAVHAVGRTNKKAEPVWLALPFYGALFLKPYSTS